MKVILLGTGGPRPDPARMGPSTLITLCGDNLIVDTGRGVATRLVQAGIPVTLFNYVFLTHLHFDHTSGLADLLFSAWNLARNKTIHVFGPRGTKAMLRHLFEAHERDIWYRLQETALTTEKLVDIREMVEVHDVERGKILDKGDWRVEAGIVDHGHGLGLSRLDWPCLSYRFTEGTRSVVVTGDAVLSGELVEFAKGADILVASCYYAGEEVDSHDTRLIAQHVLMSSLEAGKLASDSKVGKIVLVHIREKPRRLLDSMIVDVKLRYDGEVIVGEDLLVVE